MRKKVSTVVGCTQIVIGAFASIFAYVLYHDFFGVQEVLNVSREDVLLYMLILIVFGLLSIISGLFLMTE